MLYFFLELCFENYIKFYLYNQEQNYHLSSFISYFSFLIYFYYLCILNLCILNLLIHVFFKYIFIDDIIATFIFSGYFLSIFWCRFALTSFFIFFLKSVSRNFYGQEIFGIRTSLYNNYR